MAINFPDGPTLGQIFQSYVWDGEKWLGASTVGGAALIGAVRYDAAQTLTRNEMSQGRANIAVTKKNYIINGGMQVSQEFGSTVVGADGYHPVDLFAHRVLGTTGNPQSAQIAVASPGGSPNRLRVTVNVADAAVAAGDAVFIQQHIEGLRVADLMFGTANAKMITIQFGVKAPAGTYCVVVENGAANHSYVAEYVIAAGEANTDVIKSVTIQGTTDVAKTWLKDNGLGMRVRWGLMAGLTYQQAAGSWGTVDAVGSANQFNFLSVTTATDPNRVFELFDVSLTEGSVAPPFQLPDFAQELVLCKRYWQKLFAFYVPAAGAPITVALPVEVRGTIAITGGGTGFTFAAAGAGASGGFVTISIYQTTLAQQNLVLNTRL